MEPFEGCGSYGDDLCAQFENVTKQYHNICLTYEAGAQRKFNDQSFTCHYVYTVVFLIEYCIQLPTWTHDVPTCVTQYGIPAGICMSLYPNKNSRLFQMCFNIIVDTIGELGNETTSDWTFHSINALCSSVNASQISVCRGMAILDDAVFNITRYCDNEFIRTIFAYILPPVGTLVVITNSTVLVLMVKVKSNPSFKFFLGSIFIVDILIPLTVCPVFVRLLNFGNCNDYLEYDWCVIAAVVLDVLSPVLHGIATWCTLGLVIQRYLIVKFPFKARAYSSRNLAKKTITYIIMVSIIMVCVYIPEISYISKLQYHEIMSKLDPSKTVGTAIQVLIRTESENIKIVSHILRMVFNQMIPLLFTVVFEIGLIRALREQRKQRQQMNDVQVPDSKMKVIIAVTSANVMATLAVELPFFVIFMTRFLSLMYNFDIVYFDNISAVFNIMALLIFTANAVVCCCISKDFRDMLLCRSRAA